MKTPTCPSCGNPLAAGKPKCSVCGYSSVPEWLRLWFDDSISMTFREDSTPVTRNLFHTYFRHVLTPGGQPAAAYFPSDESPLFVIEKREEGWFASSSGEYRNKALLDDTELNSSLWEIKDGSRLDLYSGNEAAVVVSFVFRFL